MPDSTKPEELKPEKTTPATSEKPVAAVASEAEAKAPAPEAAGQDKPTEVEAAKPEASAESTGTKPAADTPAPSPETAAATPVTNPPAAAPKTPAAAAPVSTPAAPEVKAPASETPTPETPATATTPPDEPKPKRGLFGRRKLESKPAETTPATPLTPATVIEALDPGTAPKVTAEELAKQLDAQLEEAKHHGGAWTFSLTKDKLLVLSAVLLLLVWLVPTLDLVRQLRSVPEPVVETEPASIRVKYSAEAKSDAEAIKVLLETKDLGPVELIEESQPNPGVSLVGKPSVPDLANAVLLALTQDYQVATGSSILTEDSQVSVLILVGPESTESSEVLPE